MLYKAEIVIMPIAAILDPQGKAVGRGLHNLGLKEVSNVRIGKHITLHINADSKSDAEARVEEACQKLLANRLMETYTFTLTEHVAEVS